MKKRGPWGTPIGAKGRGSNPRRTGERKVFSEKDGNIVLIGMPAVGKSTIGVLLAKAVSRDFIDTDVRIQACEGRSLQEIIDRKGLEEFCRIEERHILSLACRGKVIATGGSVVYSPAAMAHLRSLGAVVHLVLDLAAIRKRLTNLDSRGLVLPPGKTLDFLYEERMPLYRQYAEFTVNCGGKTHEEIVAEIIAAAKKT